MKTRNHELETEHVEELNVITAKNCEAQDAHQKHMLNMETEFHRKIIVEYEKNKELTASFNKLRDESNAKLRKTAGYLEDTIESMESDFKQQIESRRERIQQLVDCNENLKLEFVEYCRQERAQFERQLVAVRLEYEKKMLHENEVNSKWRGEAGVMSKKFAQVTKENKRLREDFVEVQEANKELQLAIDTSKEMEELQEEIERQQLIVQEKDRQLDALKNVIHELEVERTELNKEIAIVRGQIPKDEEVRRKADELRSLTAELESLSKSNVDLERMLKGQKLRTEGLTMEVKEKVNENQKLKTFNGRVIADIHLLNEFILKPENLSKEVGKLFSK